MNKMYYCDVNINGLEGTLIGFEANPPAEMIEAYKALTQNRTLRHSPRGYKVSVKTASDGKKGDNHNDTGTARH